MAASRRADVAVVGAGPAGATVARILALGDVQVALLDPPSRRLDRLELLAPAAQPLLQSLDLGALLSDSAIASSCYGIRRRWGAVPEHFDDFLRHPLRQGYVVDRARFDTALRSRAVSAGALLLKSRAVGVERSQGAMHLRLSGAGPDSQLQVKCVVDATGRPAAIARRLGARRELLSALVARQTSAAAPTAPGYLQVESLRGGWGYSVEGPSGRRECWQLSRPEGPRRGRSDQASVDASSARLDRAAGRGWLAVGDAAASFDPITSQGLVNALSTALVAAGMILKGYETSARAASSYSDAVRRTHERSELVRTAIYADLEVRAGPEAAGMAAAGANGDLQLRRSRPA